MADVERQHTPISNSTNSKFDNRKTRFETSFKRFFGISWPGYGPVLLWTITVTGFFVLTVFHLTSIIKEYRENNETVQMKVRHLKSVKFLWPNMTVCIPYYSSQLARLTKLMNDNWDKCQNWDQRCRNMTQSDFALMEKCRGQDLDEEACMNSSLDPSCYLLHDRNLQSTCAGLKQLWNGWVDVEMLRVTSDNPFVESKVTKFLFQKAITDYSGDLDLLFLEASYNISGFPSRHQLMLDAVWKYIQCIFKVDLLAIVDGDTQNNTNGCAWIVNVSLLHNISALDGLFLKSVGLMEEKFEFEIPSIHNLLSRENLHGEGRILIVDDKLCLPLPLDSGNHTAHNACKTHSGYDSESGCYVFHVLKHNQWNTDDDADAANFVERIEFYDDPMPLYSPQELNSFYVFSPRDLVDVNANVNVSKSRNAILQYSVASRMLTKEVRSDCLDTAYVDCFLWARLNATIQLCKCNPFSLTYANISKLASPNLPYCSVHHYLKCADKLELPSDLDATRKKCRNKCERTIYAWENKAVADTLDNGTVFQFRPNEDPFLEFSQTPKDTLSQFLANIGGAVNLYLGASGLTACALIIFGIDLLKRLYRLLKKKELESKRNSEAADPSMHMRGHVLWMTTAMMLRSQQSKNDTDGIDELREKNHELEGKVDDLRQQNQGLKDTVKRMDEALLKMQKQLKKLDGELHRSRSKGKYAV